MVRNLMAVGLVALFFIACSNTGGLVSTDGQGSADAVVEDLTNPADQTNVNPDVVGDQVERTEDLPRFDFVGDLQADQFEPGCDPGEGCFLDKCDDNSECQSGWCLEHLGEGVCTMTCLEECPPGWSCEEIGGGGPDLSFVCVSTFSNLCRPCATGADCKAAGGAEDVCLDYGDEGSFCGGACTVDDDCPWGFSCVEAVTVAGVSTTQCVADSGVCPCTSKSVQLALTTPCEIANETGSCPGKRVCAEEGLTSCDAQVPTAESCNGLDDDCDGEIDEPELVQGEYVGLCNDGNECTDDACLGEAGCEHIELDQGECKDGDACTVGDHCEAGKCVGLPVLCDDSNPCTDDACDGLGGCAATFNTASCDDQDPCTVNDSCKEGKCVGFNVDCSCQQNSDCGEFEDGDKCNGTLYCDTSSLPYLCKVDVNTVVSCPVLEGQEAICAKSVCDAESGTCKIEPDHSGYACDDGDACTVGDKCVAGGCAPGVAALCDDNNVCTDDSCDVAGGCVNTPNAAVCNDGDPCTTVDMCAAGVCVGSEEKVCVDGNVCTLDSCVAGQGCHFEAVAGDCDDGNACTELDLCMGGICKGSGSPNCNDNNACTTDVCLPEQGCVNTPAAGSCSDGNPCTLNDVCKGGLCQSGALLECDDKNSCTVDTCSPLGVCEYAALDGDCDDGNACTIGDHCVDGECLSSGLLNCDDDNVCTSDSCNPTEGCLSLLNSAPCDDGDVCTYGDHCSLGECVSSGLLNCDDSNPCTDDSCSPEVGCQFVPNNAACDDGTECSVDDACSGGVCKGVLVDCDDNSVCTKDWCDIDLGCQHSALVGPCSDGTDCTVGDSCANGICVPGPLLDCDDANPCTIDSCHPQAGCEHVPNADPCDDDDACTVGDVCSGGECQPGGAKDCDDDNVCTGDSCAPDKGCVYILNTLPCDNGNGCTENDVCVGGECTAGPQIDCDDSDPCTNDSCTPEDGCINTEFFPCCGNGIKEGGEECDDGNHVGGDGCEEDCTEFTAVDVTFTNCSKTGPVGPSQSDCNNAYNGQVFLSGKVSVSGGVQTWTVPFTGNYRFEAYGAKGGCNGGNGARMRGDFQLDKGTELKIIVGHQGLCAPASVGNGGGGGSFVVKADNTPLIIAAGGGGTGHNSSYPNHSVSTGKTGTSGSAGLLGQAGAGGTNGNGGKESYTTGNGTPNGAGGGGLLTNGGSAGSANGGKSFLNGGQGGDSTGGYGGGGGTNHFVYGCGSSPHGGSGGGGYSGGGAGGDNCNGPGGGGGSWNSGANASNSEGVNGGHGKVHVVRL